MQELYKELILGLKLYKNVNSDKLEQLRDNSKYQTIFQFFIEGAMHFSNKKINGTKLINARIEFLIEQLEKELSNHEQNKAH